MQKKSNIIFSTIIVTTIVLMITISSYAQPAAARGDEITKAEAVAKVVDFFQWPHLSEYNDIWHPGMPQFNDVDITDLYGKQIECAYEEGLVGPDENGNFNPNAPINREEVAFILGKSFDVPLTDRMTIFSDNACIDPGKRPYVNTLADMGFMEAKEKTLFKPKDSITREEFNSLFNEITSTLVAPVQALPKDWYTSPRRYVKLYCPTPGATVYFTNDGSEPTTESEIYTPETKGHIMEMVGSRGGGPEATDPERDVVYKAFAEKEGMETSSIKTYEWHLYRPLMDDYQHDLIVEGNDTIPTVYRIYNDSDTVRPMMWYVEGPDSGIMFDLGQTPADQKNLVEYLEDNNIATKPYIAIIGHEHGDHDAQGMNFVNAGIDVYLNERGWAATASSGHFAAIFATPEAQEKVKNIREGMQFDLGGGIVFDVYAVPGHANGNISLHDKQSGMWLASDYPGCTRAGSADNVGISGLKADLQLSFVQQLRSKMAENDGNLSMIFTGHDESPLEPYYFQILEAAWQQVIDFGEAGCTPTLRTNDQPLSRTTLIGDMWKDGVNWTALKIGGVMGDDYEYLTHNDEFNYNEENGIDKYSVLSNIEIEGGDLVGTTVAWAPPGPVFNWAGEEITVPNEVQGRFDPWTYEYTVNVIPRRDDLVNEITIIPTTMSSRAKSIKINGEEVGYKTRNTVKVDEGTVITIEVVAPDNKTTSTYTLTVDML